MRYVNVRIESSVLFVSDFACTYMFHLTPSATIIACLPIPHHEGVIDIHHRLKEGLCGPSRWL